MRGPEQKKIDPAGLGGALFFSTTPTPLCCRAKLTTKPPAAAMKADGESARRSALALSLQSSVLVTMMASSGVVARKPDGLVVVSRHGVRRQFPSSTHDFTKYAPGKVFATEDEVRESGRL